jgi:hypothetical protein
LMVYNGTIIVRGPPDAVKFEYVILHFKN